MEQSVMERRKKEEGNWGEKQVFKPL